MEDPVAYPWAGGVEGGEGSGQVAEAAMQVGHVKLPLQCEDWIVVHHDTLICCKLIDLKIQGQDLQESEMMMCDERDGRKRESRTCLLLKRMLLDTRGRNAVIVEHLSAN